MYGFKALYAQWKIIFAIKQQPTDLTVYEGEQPAFTIQAVGEGLTYQWKYSKDNGATWKDSTDAKTAKYTISATASKNGYLVRCKVTDGAGVAVTSDAVKLTVQ